MYLIAQFVYISCYHYPLFWQNLLMPLISLDCLLRWGARAGAAGGRIYKRLAGPGAGLLVWLPETGQRLRCSIVHTETQSDCYLASTRTIKVHFFFILLVLKSRDHYPGPLRTLQPTPNVAPRPERSLWLEDIFIMVFRRVILHTIGHHLLPKCPHSLKALADSRSLEIWNKYDFLCWYSDMLRSYASTNI